jgi:hypothetical protein
VVGVSANPKARAVTKVRTEILYAEYQTLIQSISKRQAVKQLAARYGLTEHGVRGRISAARARANETVNSIERLDADYWRREAERLAAENAALKAQAEAMYDASPRDESDWGAWVSAFQKLKMLPRMVKVMAWNDMHAPDTDMQALDLAFQIAERLQPDINIVGSDAFDFDTLSLKFKRAHNRKTRDIFYEVRPHWDGFTERLTQVTPNAVNLAIADNHASGRLATFIDECAAMLGDTIVDSFADLVRSSGRVLWLGFQQEFRIGKLLIEHGLKAGENAAKSSMLARGGATPKMQGHGHYPASHVNVIDTTADDGVSQFHYPVQSIMTGHLGNPRAHYAKHTDFRRWVQGVGIAYVNLHGVDVHFQNVLFHPRMDGSLACVFGEHELVQTRSKNATLSQVA